MRIEKVRGILNRRETKSTTNLKLLIKIHLGHTRKICINGKYFRMKST